MLSLTPRQPTHFHTLLLMWLGFSSSREGHVECEVIAYFCNVRLRSPVQFLILFWASRWFMPSVEMPSMERTRSPIATPPLAAFPPSVSCRNTKTTERALIIYITRNITARIIGEAGWVKVMWVVRIHSVVIRGFIDLL